MNVSLKEVLIRVLFGLGYTIPIILGYYAFNMLILQTMWPIKDYVGQQVFDVFIIGLTLFTFASGFLRQTIFKYFADGGRDLFMMYTSVNMAEEGMIRIPIQGLCVEADATAIITLFLLVVIVDFARTLVSAVSYLAEKEAMR